MLYCVELCEKTIASRPISVGEMRRVARVNELTGYRA